jgi:hypothetical protein
MSAEDATRPCAAGSPWGQKDLNLRPASYQDATLTGLSYTPRCPAASGSRAACAAVEPARSRPVGLRLAGEPGYVPWPVRVHAHPHYAPEPCVTGLAGLFAPCPCSSWQFLVLAWRRPSGRRRPRTPAGFPAHPVSSRRQPGLLHLPWISDCWVIMLVAVLW